MSGSRDWSGVSLVPRAWVAGHEIETSRAFYARGGTTPDITEHQPLERRLSEL